MEESDVVSRGDGLCAVSEQNRRKLSLLSLTKEQATVAKITVPKKRAVPMAVNGRLWGTKLMLFIGYSHQIDWQQQAVSFSCCVLEKSVVKL